MSPAAYWCWARPFSSWPRAPVPRYEVKRVSTALTIDGKLDETGWAAAPVAALQFLWVARLPDDFQLPQGGVLTHAVADERVGAAARDDVLDRVSNVLKVNPVVLHSAAASARIRCWRCGLIPPSVKTSTDRPRSSSRSCSSALTSRSVRPGSTSTSRSTSLFGPASPRAVEPNSRTFRAP